MPHLTQQQTSAHRAMEGGGWMAASPPVAFQIFNLIHEPDYPSESLVHLVRLDPELTAQILRVVNSVQLRGKGVTSVDEAIMRLGAAEIANTALSLTVGRLVGKRPTAYCPNPAVLWRHSVECALACRHLRVVCDNVRWDDDLAFTAGLLHDFGKIMINGFPPEALAAIAKGMTDDGLSAADAEQAALGADHAELGGSLLERWGLPAALAAAVRFHHAPEFDSSGLATLVHVGNSCAKAHAGSRDWQEFQDSLQPHSLERLGLSRRKVEECWGDVLRSMDDVDSLVGC